MMFQPFALFKNELLQAMLSRDKKFFVRQSLKPAGTIRERSFLISPYNQKVTAEDHFCAIAHDPLRYLYNWEIPEHRQRLHMASMQPPGFKIFAGVFSEGWESMINDRIREKIKLYVKSLGWKPLRDERVSTRFELQFGEIFIRLQYAQREVMVKFEEIEKIY